MLASFYLVTNRNNTTTQNRKFDASLKSKDSSSGVRDLEEVVDIAKKEGLEFVQRVEMPANNLSVLFRKN